MCEMQYKQVQNKLDFRRQINSVVGNKASFIPRKRRLGNGWDAAIFKNCKGSGKQEQMETAGPRLEVKP